MKLYEVRIVKKDFYYGTFDGYTHIAYVLNPEKGEELRREAVAKILATRKDWKYDHYTDDNGEPKVEVAELGEIWEG